MTVRDHALRLGLTADLADAAARRPPPFPLTGAPLVACDLDRTLIYSAAALGLAGPDADPDQLNVVELREGRPLSYRTRRAELLTEALSRAAPLVPVTTRTLEQLRRVRLTRRPPAYAVAANGGWILAGGRPDPSWTAAVTARVSSDCTPLGEVRERLHRISDPAWMLRLRTADDLFCYAIVNRATLPPALTAELTEWCSARGWLVSVQGRKLYCVPRPLTKLAAVAEIRRRLGRDQLIAAGDSLLDRELLAAADAGIRPAHGELHEHGWYRDRVAVTETAGVRAGEEIAACLLGWSLATAV